jgi:Tol biopolymer transport system component
MGAESGDFTVSTSGVLAYRSAGAQERSLLQWVSRDGRVLGEAGPPGVYEDVAFSPDGKRLAVTVVGDQPATRDVWIRDLVRGVSSRLTFDASDDIWPVWSPDGLRIAYCDNRDGEFRCFAKPANGVGAEDSLAHVRGGQDGVTDWSAPANVMLISRFGANGWDIWAQPADGTGAPHPVIQTPFNERAAKLSPDGRWMTYSSNESGRAEVYVVPYPGPGGKWQVSTAGGLYPQWRADGKELFFQAPDQTLMSVAVTTGASFEVGVPAPLFHARLRDTAFSGYRWAPDKDGQRFLVDTPAGAAAAGRFVVASEWTSELKQR